MGHLYVNIFVDNYPMINFVKRSILSTFSLSQRLDKIDPRLYFTVLNGAKALFIRLVTVLLGLYYLSDPIHA